MGGLDLLLGGVASTRMENSDPCWEKSGHGRWEGSLESAEGVACLLPEGLGHSPAPLQPLPVNEGLRVGHQFNCWVWMGLWLWRSAQPHPHGGQDSEAARVGKERVGW